MGVIDAGSVSPRHWVHATRVPPGSVARAGACSRALPCRARPSRDCVSANASPPSSFRPSPPRPINGTIEVVCPKIRFPIGGGRKFVDFPTAEEGKKVYYGSLSFAIYNLDANANDPGVNLQHLTSSDVPMPINCLRSSNIRFRYKTLASSIP